MLKELLEYDTQLFLYLNGLGNMTWDGFWLLVTNKLTFVPLYILLLYLMYKNYNVKSFVIIILIIAVMITFTDQTTNLFKRSVARLRPCALDEIKDTIRYIAERCSTRRSFFSGHAANSMAAAIFGGLVLKKIYKKLFIVLILWAFTVAYSRIYVGVHFPLDIFCGMLFGALSGLCFYKLTLYVINRFNRS